MKKKMTSKGWLIAFFVTVLAIALGVAGFNFCMDPFGAFGDLFFHWWSYDETMNPRVAKLSYLEQNHDQYDSYIIGPSSTSSFPAQPLNEYFDASFYNLFMYGSDMKDVEDTCRYIIGRYTVKNLVVNLYIHNAVSYDSDPNPLTYNLHCKVDGTSPLLFYGKYLFADPRISWEKLQHWQNDPYLQQSYRVFDEETGAYDKSRRDVEPIGSLEDYLQQPGYSIFNNYPAASEPSGLPKLEECMASLRAIKDLCDENGINLVVTCPPLYHAHVEHYSQEDQAAFRNALAQVTDYWDFTLSSISYDPRYFYDESHFRNSVGEMALAKMFGDSSVYCPEDLGEHVLQGETPGALREQSAEASEYTAQVPILMYHHVTEAPEDNSDTVTAAQFEEHMQALVDAGYEAVTFEDLQAYVNQGADLPDKPVVITFDDGYESNYTLAYPILQKYGLKATIFVIGVSVGKDTYKDTGEPMTPHLSLEQAQEMQGSGLISIQSHGYDIHQVPGRDPEPVREGVLQREDESEEDYIQMLREDCQKMENLLGCALTVLAYPYGSSSTLSEVILGEMGIVSTLTIHEKTNCVIRGLPQSLRGMGRYYILNTTSADDVLAMLGE